MHATTVLHSRFRLRSLALSAGVILLIVIGLAQMDISRVWFAADSESASIFADESFGVAPVFVPAEHDVPRLHAREAVLIDVDTGIVLYSHGSGEIRSLASLTKLVTMYVVLDLVENGTVSLDDRIEPVPEAFWNAMPARSSVLFLGVDQRVRIETLLLGLSIASGNDAATALAYHIDGSVPAFARRMEDVLDELGLTTHSFVEPSGIDRRNRAGAEDFARFVAQYLRRFPDAPDRFHTVPTLVFPTVEDYAGRWNPVSVTHHNRNLLIREYPDADGLKTGFTYSAGYSLAASARRGGRRVAAVVLGVDAPNARIGSRLRTDDAIALLDHAYDAYDVLTPGHPSLEPVRVRGGEVPTVPVSVVPPEMILPRADVSHLSGELQLDSDIRAPVRERQIVGRIVYRLYGEELAAVPVFSQNEVRASTGILSLLDRAQAALGM